VGIVSPLPRPVIQKETLGCRIRLEINGEIVPPFTFAAQSTIWL
jgi:hypothetical protein